MIDIKHNNLYRVARTLAIRRISMLVLLFAVTVANADSTLLINANVVDVNGERVIADVTVLIDDGIIQSIGSAPATTKSDVNIIDIEGMYLLPGYIDAHVHIDSVAGAMRALGSGVTTARSASTAHFQDVALNALFHAGGIAGPEIIPAGTLIDRNLGETILGDSRLAEFHDGVTTEGDLRRFVRINIDRGAQWIKTRNTASPFPYFSDNDRPAEMRDMREMVLSASDLDTIVDEAGRHGRPVMIHSFGDPAALAAVQAAVKSVEHGTFATAETLRLMKERDIFLVPTLLAFRDATEPRGELRTTHFQHHLAPMIQAGVIEMWEDAHRIGVKMVLSTDSTYNRDSLNRIGAGVTEYVRLGMTPYEALRAATLLPAELLGIQDRTGQLAEGYEADIIAIYSDPTRYPDAFQDVVFVMSDGKIARNQFPFAIK